MSDITRNDLKKNAMDFFEKKGYQILAGDTGVDFLIEKDSVKTAVIVISRDEVSKNVVGARYVVAYPRYPKQIIFTEKKVSEDVQREFSDADIKFISIA